MKVTYKNIIFQFLLVLVLCLFMKGCGIAVMGYGIMNPPDPYEISIPSDINLNKIPNVTIYRQPKTTNYAGMYYPSLNDVAFTSLHNNEYTEFYINPGRYEIGAWYAKARNKHSQVTKNITIVEGEQRCFIFKPNLTSKDWVEIFERDCKELEPILNKAEKIDVGKYSTCRNSGKVKTICF